MHDLGEIARYIAGDNPDEALRVGAELVALAESLSELPRRGGFLKDRPGVRRLVSAPHLETYRIGETQRVVYVLRYWHAKRDHRSRRIL